MPVNAYRLALTAQLAQAIRHFQTERNLSQKRIAELLDVKQSNLSTILSEQRALLPRTVRRLALELEKLGGDIGLVMDCLSAESVDLQRARPTIRIVTPTHAVDGILLRRAVDLAIFDSAARKRVEEYSGERLSRAEVDVVASPLGIIFDELRGDHRAISWREGDLRPPELAVYYISAAAALAISERESSLLMLRNWSVERTPATLALLMSSPLGHSAESHSYYHSYVDPSDANSQRSAALKLAKKLRAVKTFPVESRVGAWRLEALFTELHRFLGEDTPAGFTELGDLIVPVGTIAPYLEALDAGTLSDGVALQVRHSLLWAMQSSHNSDVQSHVLYSDAEPSSAGWAISHTPPTRVLVVRSKSVESMEALERTARWLTACTRVLQEDLGTNAGAIKTAAGYCAAQLEMQGLPKALISEEKLQSLLTGGLSVGFSAGDPMIDFVPVSVEALQQADRARAGEVVGRTATEDMRWKYFFEALEEMPPKSPLLSI